jgi:hypothetical protein
MRASKILALSLAVSLSAISSVIAHETIAPHPSYHGGPYKFIPMMAQEQCLIPGQVNTPVQVKDCELFPLEDREWYVFHVSRFEQLYHPKTTSCLNVKKGVVTTTKCKKGTLKHAIWDIRSLDDDDVVQFATGGQCLNSNSDGSVSLLNCYHPLPSLLWKITNNEKLLPKTQTGGADARTAGDCNICELQPVKGPCDGHIPRFYYNVDAGTCKEFIYGGCEGNQNNFKTREKCKATCKK